MNTSSEQASNQRKDLSPWNNGHCRPSHVTEDPGHLLSDICTFCYQLWFWPTDCFYCTTESTGDYTNESMRAILGCSKDTAAEAMRYLLGFPTMAERHKIAQIKAFLKVSEDKKHQLHSKVGQRTQSRLRRGAEWMTEAAQTIENSVSVESIRSLAPWAYFDDYQSCCYARKRGRE